MIPFVRCRTTYAAFDGFFFSNGTLNDDGILSSFALAVDIAEHNDYYEVTVDIPGVQKDDIKVTPKTARSP